jgi:hypothetical protein
MMKTGHTKTDGMSYRSVQLEHRADHKFEAVTRDYTIPGAGRGFELAATLLGEFKQKGTLFELNLS